MGYFHLTLERNIVLAPVNFGPKMREAVYERLRTEVEGTCSGRYGFVVMVTNVKKISDVRAWPISWAAFSDAGAAGGDSGHERVCQVPRHV
jgi:hypothetical protein